MSLPTQILICLAVGLFAVGLVFGASRPRTPTDWLRRGRCPDCHRMDLRWGEGYSKRTIACTNCLSEFAVEVLPGLRQVMMTEHLGKLTPERGRLYGVSAQQIAESL